jgi:hypothetical protein
MDLDFGSKNVNRIKLSLIVRISFIPFSLNQASYSFEGGGPDKDKTTYKLVFFYPGIKGIFKK